MQHSEGLARSLQSRHIQLIALGGTIGVGLFLGSANAIHKAGPGLLPSATRPGSHCGTSGNQKRT